MKEHHYKAEIKWMGNEGNGTSGYTAYNRNHTTTIQGKNHVIEGSSDPSFRGDKSRYNPEELFLSSIATCHMLWYLHLCSVHKVVVTAYEDYASATMQEDVKGSGRFSSVVLHPRVQVSDSTMLEMANALHEEANKMCFIANSCNFKIEHEPTANV
ncbi:MAG: OsmC family protein [Bacteroidota bacterium]